MAALPAPILSPELPAPADALRAAMTAHYARDETALVRELVEQAGLPEAQRELVLARATELVARVRVKAA
ncbi:MAG: hypothetical protein KA911_13135, partial [Xanthomonadales bacterium]|nr:hypothetical protein [Xanthomonadales bacterium]